MALGVKYNLEMKLGTGGFAQVVLALCRKTGVCKAAKVIDGRAMKYGRPSMEVDIFMKCEHRTP